MPSKFHDEYNLPHISSKQVENEELREFEMLEEAANMSFSSQLSLFNDPPKHAPLRQPITNLVRTGNTSSTGGVERLVSRSNVRYHLEPVNDKDESEHDTSGDLDETLKCSPSLARGVEFNDEEAWESFNHGSPQSRHRNESSGSDVSLPHLSPSGRSKIWNSLVKKEVLGRATGFAALHQAEPQCDVARTFKSSPSDENCITAVEKCKVVAAPEMPASSSARPLTSQVLESTGYQRRHTTNPHFYTTELSGSSGGSSNGDGVESQDSLPPPSALVSKLFPVLRRVEKQPNTTPHSVREGHTPLFKSPSPISSTEGDSGIRSLSSTSVALSEDLKYKLTQLEEEIARYRSENASLEKLRKEREDVSVCECVS